MKIKKFNQINESNSDRLIEFEKKFNKIVNYDENEYEQGDEPSNADIFSSIGDLLNNMNLTIEELEELLNRNKSNTDYDRWLKPFIKEYYNEELEKKVDNELLSFSTDDITKKDIKVFIKDFSKEKKEFLLKLLKNSSK